IMSEQLNASGKTGPSADKVTIQDWLGGFRIAVISANIMALAFAGVIIWACGKLGDDGKAFTLNVLICLLGGVLGWGLGILATPIAPDDTGQFAKIGQVISAFASGYLVSKLDRFLEHGLYDSDHLVANAWQRLC